MPHQGLIGTEVGGRYKIVRLIDQGGMGAVYEVVHKLLGRKFAMKTLATHLVGDNDALDRFRREAEVIATLHHPNIIDVIDWEQLSSGTPCMVLELLRGENLGARIARTGPLDWPTIATIGDQVLSALEAAHRANIVHRDLKPQNVFLAEDDTGDISVKLLDFGVSKIRHAQSFQTTDDRLLGTPAFMSPEQADGRQGDIGPQTDVWAMGALLFMMATGKPPFPASSVPQLLYRICHGEPLAIADHRDDAPVAFCELIGRALSRDQTKRITGARDLRRGLRAALGMATPSLEADHRHDDNDDAVAYVAPAEARPVAPASGTITFLLTEIEGSAQLWERHPESMNESIARHDALMRAEIERQGGYVFKSIGDAIHAAFSDAVPAALAATEAQRRLAAMDRGDRPALRARMAIHTGPAHERGGDYFGPTLHRVGRMLSLAHGGQVLLSSASEEVLRAQLPEGCELVDLGIYRLRDLSRPEHVYQLSHPDLARQFETLKTSARTRTNLPNPLTSFVGRLREIQEVTAALSESRLVTLTGLGGCGKTRLSIRVATIVHPQYGHGVWFVDLASLTDGGLLAQTIGEVIGVVGEGMFGASEPWPDRLAKHLQDKRVLLVLDNCEHLTFACSHLATVLLSRCEQLSILATSREPLGVPGESVYPLSPFGAGGLKDSDDLGSISKLDSVQLFVERARLSQPTFMLTNENARVVRNICRQLDGLPLAIELAAARLTVLSADSLNQRLKDRFSLLKRADKSLAPRQRSLRALLDWSHELLTQPERTLFARLAVFRGTFGLNAVEAVCCGGDVDDADVLDVLDQLAQKSLVQRADNAGEPRYRLLETVREYAHEKLTELNDEQRLRERHCEWYVALAERSEPELLAREQTATFDLLELESDNIRAALSWSLETGTDHGLRIGGALLWFWMTRGHISEGRRHLEKALDASGRAEKPVAAAARTKALAACGALTLLADSGKGKEQLKQSIAWASEANDRLTRARAHFWLGLANLYGGELGAAQEHLRQARTQCLALRDDWGLGMACMVLGPLTGVEERQTGETFARESLAAFQRVGDRVGTALSLINLGEIARTHNEHAMAVEVYEQGLELCREVGNWHGAVAALANLGMSLSALGESRRADEVLRQCLRLSQEIGHRMIMPHTVLGLAGIALADGQLQRSAQLLGVSEMLNNAVSGQFYLADQAYFEDVYFRLREVLDPELLVAEWKRGSALTVDDAITFALGRGPVKPATPDFTSTNR